MPQRRLLLSASLLLCFASSARAACDKTLSISSSDYAPYIYLNRTHQWAGLDVELMKAIFAEANCNYIFAPLVAPKRMVDMVSQGKTDVLLAASDNPERRKANYFGPAYRYESVSLIALADKAAEYRDIKSFEDIQKRNLRLLVPNAGWYGHDYARALPSLRLTGLAIDFTYFDQGIRMLAAGRGVMMMSDTAAMFIAARDEHVAIETLPFTITKAPVHMMFSKASVSEHDVKEISEATLRLEKRGVLQQIRAEYGLREAPPQPAQK